jgi:hypothetical protein
MTNVITRNAEVQRAVEATERLAQAQNGLRLGDPGHKVREFNAEVLGRAAEMVSEMGHEFDKALRRIVEHLGQFKQELLLIGWSGIRFAETKWLVDGQLEMRFMVDRPVPPDPELFHAIVDPFVSDVVEQFELPSDFRDELAGFVKGLMLQFAVIKKHVPSFDLRAVRFERFAWTSYDVLRCEINYAGKKLLPRDIGW